MSFASMLDHLRDAANTRQKGVSPDMCYVRREALRELIYHFDRLDAEVRYNAPANPRKEVGE